MCHQSQVKTKVFWHHNLCNPIENSYTPASGYFCMSILSFIPDCHGPFTASLFNHVLDAFSI